MRSYSDTITRHQAYIERCHSQVKGFEIDHAFACLLIVYGKWTVTAYFRKEHNTHTETDKSMYKALSLHGKQLLLKRDQSRSHKSAI